MTKVYCADYSCKYLDENGVCTLKEIGLAWTSVVTRYDGRQEYNKCKMYHKSERFQEMEKFIENCKF